MKAAAPQTYGLHRAPVAPHPQRRYKGAGCGFDPRSARWPSTLAPATAAAPSEPSGAAAACGMYTTNRSCRTTVGVQLAAVREDVLVDGSAEDDAVAMNSDFIWFNGELVPYEDATVHVLSHTLHYGFGVFEGIRAYRRSDGSSHIFRLREHIRRLFESAHILGMKIPYTQADLVEACIKTLRANRFGTGYLRPIVYLGSETMGLGALNNPVEVAIASWQWTAYLGEQGMRSGVRCKVSSFNRLHVNVNMVKGKICGQYVNSVIAKREALAAGYDEAIMLDTNGYVSECTGENLFMVRNGRVITAPMGSSILGGLTRDALIQICHDLGVVVEERLFTRDELYIADEVFLCGTAAELTPVREVDDRAIGRGTPGEITSRISDRFFDIIKGDHPDHSEWRHGYTLDD